MILDTTFVSDLVFIGVVALVRIPMNSDTHSENNRTLIRDCRTVVGA